jgi:hypothetical protein
MPALRNAGDPDEFFQLSEESLLVLYDESADNLRHENLSSGGPSNYTVRVVSWLLEWRGIPASAMTVR